MFLPGKIDLKKSETQKNDFERGKTDEFLLKTKDVGHLQRIVWVTCNKAFRNYLYELFVIDGWYLLQHTLIRPL